MRKLNVIVMVIHAFTIINWTPFFLKISRFRVTITNYKKDAFSFFKHFSFIPE